MHDDSREARKSNRTLYIVLGVVVSLILLVLAVCGGGIYVFLQVAKQGMAFVGDIVSAQATAEEFLADIRSNRPEDAYGKTAAGFREKLPLAEFKKLVEKDADLKKAVMSNAVNMNANGGNVTVNTGNPPPPPPPVKEPTPTPDTKRQQPPAETKGPVTTRKAAPPPNAPGAPSPFMKMDKFPLDVRSQDGQVTFHFILVKEEDSWKIEDLTYANKRLPPEKQ
jgi:hypothetical protein